jgi:hypothetical protein
MKLKRSALVCFIGLVISCLPQLDPATQKLVDTLNDGNAPWPQREAAARELGRLKNPDTVPYLVNIMGGAGDAADFQLSAAACQALDDIGAPAVPALIDQLKNSLASNGMRLNAMIALSNMGEPAVGPLIEELKNFDPSVREIAADILSKITGQNFGTDYDRWKEYRAAVQGASGTGQRLLDAASEGDIETAGALIASGTSVGVADKYGCTPLHLAAINGRTEMTEFLIAHGADVNARMITQETPLHGAAQKSQIATALLLLDKGADINATDANGQTALHVACFEGHLEMAELLIDRGADVNAAGDDGITPLQMAAGQHHQDVVDILKKRGAR